MNRLWIVNIGLMGESIVYRTAGVGRVPWELKSELLVKYEVHQFDPAVTDHLFVLVPKKEEVFFVMRYGEMIKPKSLPDFNHLSTVYRTADKTLLYIVPDMPAFKLKRIN